MTVRELEQAIARMLKEAGGEANRLSPVELRTNLAEFFDELDERLARSPKLAAQPQWTVWINDLEEDEPAVFAAAVVSASGVELFAGTGEAAELKAFEERHQASAAALPSELGARFTLAPTQVRAPRLTANAWVGHE